MGFRKEEMKKNIFKKNPMQSKTPKEWLGSLVLYALAAIAFVGLIVWANHDRPVYKSSDTSGVEYEVARVNRVL